MFSCAWYLTYCTHNLLYFASFVLYYFVMIGVTDLRNGTFFQMDGNLYRVYSYEHTKVGRGGATVKVKVKNLLSGSTTTQTFQSGKKVEEADIKKVTGIYKYRTQDHYVFEADDEDHIEVSHESASEEGPYLSNNMEVIIMLFRDEPIGITLPIKYIYSVKEAPPDARGNSANASTKEVLLTNNLKVKTPMFIKEGDSILVDTRTGYYISRA